MKFKMLFLCLILTLLLCACGKTAEGTSRVRTVTVNGTAYVIDDAAGTISDGKYTYVYSLQVKNSDDYSLEITYPDGSSWWWTENGTIGSGGNNARYYSRNPDYPEGFELRDVLEAQTRRSGGGNSTNPLLVIVLLIAGLLNTFATRTVWNLRYGWHYKEAEPSELSLVLGRIVGILCLAAALIMILVAIF